MEHNNLNNKENAIEVKERSFSNSVELNKSAEALRDNRQEMFVRNMKYLINKHKWTQKEFCNNIDNLISPTQLTMIFKSKTELSYLNVCRCALFFQVSPEDLVSKDLSLGENVRTQESNENKVDSFQKYYGTYEIAYANTGEPVGENHRETGKTLSYGIMSIYKGVSDAGSVCAKVVAYFNCQPETMESIRKQGVVLEDEYVDLYLSKAREKDEAKYIYIGYLELSPEIAEITLKQKIGNDSAHMLLHNRSATSSAGKQYKGGLAAVLSSSRGEHMPCVQAAVVSSEPIATNWSAVETENYLRMGPLKLDISEEAESIFHFMSTMFPTAEGIQSDLAFLSKEDKVECIKSFIQKKLTKPISRNYLDYFKISKAQDKAVYRRICEKDRSLDEN